MRLPRTLEAIERSKDEIARVLGGELAPIESELPLQEHCERGGFPRLDGVSVDSVVATPSHVRVRATLFFTEAIPASCGGRPGDEPRVAIVLIEIDRGTADAVVRDAFREE